MFINKKGSQVTDGKVMGLDAFSLEKLDNQYRALSQGSSMV